jgi:methylated-DNA-[protein]-cysteine S-methyltransferase
VEGHLLAGVGEARYDSGLFVRVQEKVKAYFDGSYVDFGDVEVVLRVSEFGRRVLGACRDVRYGQCVSYGDLAKTAGRERSARAVGGVLGRNPVPLIIGCHRIVRSDGKIGGFSAGGGVGLKQRMLELESRK